ncbi:hypothetical protein BN1708_001035, partial [Verticillium longisporum]
RARQRQEAHLRGRVLPGGRGRLQEGQAGPGHQGPHQGPQRA